MYLLVLDFWTANIRLWRGYACSDRRVGERAAFILRYKTWENINLH